MPLELTPLDINQLPPAVQRVVGPQVPAPAKMMAARGLAPMGPKDLVTVLYQLGRDDDTAVAKAAEQTAEKLPETILGAALKDAIDPRVIDYFVVKVLDKPALVEAVLFNGATADETFVTLASKLKERELEILAGNQQRLLSHPPIIEALYFNKAARMSTVDRLLELAVRNGLQLERIPQFEEIAASILGARAEPEPEAAPADAAAPSDDVYDAALEAAGASYDAALDPAAMDDVFSAVLEEDWDAGSVGSLEYGDDEDKRNVAISQLPVSHKVRLATLGNASHRKQLIRDRNRTVSMAAVTSPAMTDNEVIAYASDRGLSEEVIRYIGTQRKLLRAYAVKKALVNNPKCPLPITMRLLPQLRANDVRQIARSKSIPSALAQAAKRLTRK